VIEERLRVIDKRLRFGGGERRKALFHLRRELCVLRVIEETVFRGLFCIFARNILREVSEER